MDTWGEILDWIADYVIYLASTISFCITVITFFKVPLKIYRKIIIIITLLTFILAIPFYIVLFYYPITLVPIVGIIVTLSLFKANIKSNLQIYSVIVCIINCLLYYYATELSKANYSSWGSSTIFVGIFMIAFIFPHFQLIMLAHQQNKLYGILKFLTGVILLAICWITHFPPIQEGKDLNEHLNFIRYGIIFSMIVITIEGMLLIFQNNLQAKFKKLLPK